MVFMIIYSMQNCIWTIYKNTLSKILPYFIKIFTQMPISGNSFWSNLLSGTVRMRSCHDNEYFQYLKAEKFLFKFGFTIYYQLSE